MRLEICQYIMDYGVVYRYGPMCKGAAGKRGIIRDWELPLDLTIRDSYKDPVYLQFFWLRETKTDCWLDNRTRPTFTLDADEDTPGELV